MKNGDTFPSKIGILYSHVKREYFPTEDQYVTEKDAEHDALLIAAQIKKLGATPVLFPGNKTLPEQLRKEKPDMVFNLVDSVKGDEFLSSSIPGILELLEIPYTGAGILGLAVNYNKFITKELLDQNGIGVPHCQLLTTAQDELDPDFIFPVISKLNEIHGSVEITEEAVSENEQHLRKRLRKLIALYHQPVIVEQYITGRELVVMLLEGKNKKVYAAEKTYRKKAKKYFITTFSDQWEDAADEVFEYKKYENDRLNHLVRRAFDVLHMADYGKFDVRVDQNRNYFFLDANCNPAFAPADVALVNILSGLYDVQFSEILRRLIINTMQT